MIKDIGSVIAKRRSEMGVSQKELARLLNLHGMNITNQAVSKWENGTTQPGAAQFIALCSVLGIRDVISEFTGEENGGVFAGLNKLGREMAEEYISLLKLSDKYRKQDGEIVHIRSLPLYNIAASAGTGQFLDSSDYETVDVGEDVPETADFGVRLSGDSMEPRFNDGDIVWVSRGRKLKSGEIGIFLWDENVYCKKLEKTGETIRLISLNEKYPPINIAGEADLRSFGKVVGKWSTAE